MPPKKGGKGGKDAAASGPKSGEEPPQPGPSAPYCLSLQIEVSLDAAEPQTLRSTPSGEGDTAAAKSKPAGEGGKDDDNVAHIEEAPHLVEPEFRYTFVNGDKITTPSVGRPGSSWVKLDPAPTQETAQPAPSASPEKSEAKTTVGQQDMDNGRPNPIAWRYTRVHQLQGADDNEVNTPSLRLPWLFSTRYCGQGYFSKQIFSITCGSEWPTDQAHVQLAIQLSPRSL